MPKSPGALRIGIIFHGSKIWLSEFVSIICVTLLLLTLFTFSLIILRNEFTSHSYASQITALKSERIYLEHQKNVLLEKNRLAQLLCRSIGSKLPPHTIYHLSEIIYENSRQYGYDPILLLAVIRVESLFNPSARGKFKSGNLSGALGLMQIKLETAQEMADLMSMGKLSSDDLLKPEVNLVLGVAYLTKLISRFNDFKLGLLAYNAGPGVIKGNLSRKQPLSMKYYKRVLNHYYKFQKSVQELKLTDSFSACD